MPGFSTLPRPVARLLLGLFVLLAIFPPLAAAAFPEQQEFLVQKVSGIMILAIMAMSLDLLVGVTGLVSLGHAAFFGLGGYALALVSPDYESASLWVALPAALALVAVVAAVVGALAIRTSGIAFIMVTLAFGQMGYYFFNDHGSFGGSDGLFIMMRPTAEVAGLSLFSLDSPQTFYFVVLAVLIGTYVLLATILAAPFGRVIAAIGANEARARGLGFEPQRYKLATFVIGATLAGLAGFLAAAQYGYVNPAMLGWHHSGEALVMVILGGLGTLFGPILGAFAFEIARFAFESATEHWLLPMGILVIALVLALPRGIGGLMLDLATPRAPEPEDETTENTGQTPQGEGEAR